MQQFHFHSGDYHTGESIAAYVAQLHQLAKHYECDTTLNDMLRDQLVCAVDNSQIQWQLLMEQLLTFDKVFKIAMASKSAEKDVKDLVRFTTLIYLWFPCQQAEHSLQCYTEVMLSQQG